MLMNLNKLILLLLRETSVEKKNQSLLSLISKTKNTTFDIYNVRVSERERERD